MRLILTILLSLWLIGCSAIRASEAPTTNFLPFPKKLKENRKRAPFHAYWVLSSKKFDQIKKEINKIYIKPVDTTYLEASIKKRDWPEKFKTRRIEEAKEVARFMRELFRMKIEKYKENQFEILENESPDAIDLELALVELDPTNPYINALGTAAGVFVPGGGLLKIAGKGSVAFEGLEKVKSKVYTQFKDRENDKAAPFTVKDFEEYAHARQTIIEWAGQYSKLLMTSSDFMVDDSLPFTVSPL